MSWWKKIGIALGTLLALIVLFVLGVIGWFLYKIMGFIVAGIVVACLIWYIFFAPPPQPPSPS